jgi:hypothetical protein
MDSEAITSKYSIILKGILCREKSKEKELSSIEIPLKWKNTIVDYYWRVREINGNTFSIIHPLVRQRIVICNLHYNMQVNGIQSGDLTWDDLLQDNVE